MAKRKKRKKLKESKKKGFFKRFIERLAQANRESGGRICPT